MMETKKESPAGRKPVRGEISFSGHCKGVESFPNRKEILADSFESEKLTKLIADKKEFLKKQTNDFARMKLQEEVLFLERDILPIVLNETTLFYGDAIRYVIEKLKKAIKLKCDAMLCLIPLTENIQETYVIGIANPKELTVYGRLDEFDIAIEQMKRGMKINVINLPL